MRRNKVLVSHPNGSVLGSRRQFLGLGGAVFGATILAPLYPRSARAQSSGFDYYISPTGSDSNPGTQTNPWALTSINTKQSTYAGKRVGVLPGTYNCLALCGGSYTGSFSSPAFFIAGGSASAPTVIQSTTPRGAILDAGANASNNPNGQPLIGNVGSGCQYITIDGFEIKNCFNRAVSLGYQTGAYGGYSGPLSLGIVVQNCYVHALTNTLAGANTTGITIYSANGAIVQNNYLTDIADSTTRGDAIEFWTSQNSIAQFNTVIAAGPGMYAGIVNKNASNFNNSVCYNYVDLTLAAPISQGGIVMDSDGGGSTTDTAHHNIVISDYPVGAALINTGNFPASSNNQTWYNNTLIGIPNFATVGFYRMGAARTDQLLQQHHSAQFDRVSRRCEYEYKCRRVVGLQLLCSLSAARSLPRWHTESSEGLYVDRILGSRAAFGLRRQRRAFTKRARGFRGERNGPELLSTTVRKPVQGSRLEQRHDGRNSHGHGRLGKWDNADRLQLRPGSDSPGHARCANDNQRFVD